MVSSTTARMSGGQRVEADIDRVTDPSAEHLDEATGVVAAAVGAAVHDLLDALPCRVERGGDGQCGDRDGDVRALGHQCADSKDDGGAAGPEHRREQPVGEGAEFMVDHNAVIMMVVLLVFGAELVGNGLAGVTN